MFQHFFEIVYKMDFTENGRTRLVRPGRKGKALMKNVVWQSSELGYLVLKTFSRVLSTVQVWPFLERNTFQM